MLNPEIIKAFMVTAQLTGMTNITVESAEEAVKHLSRYDTDLVLKALHRCRLELRAPLTLGAVIDRLDDGHPGPEEAWAMVAKLDDGPTLVWTDQIAEAFAVVREMLDDRVAARLAFLEIYRTKLAEARAAALVPHWWVSLGWDATQRTTAIAEAVSRGRLPVAKAKALLPPAEWKPEWDPTRALPEHEGDGERQERARAVGELMDKLSTRMTVDRGPREPAGEAYFENLRRELQEIGPEKGPSGPQDA